jgi:predicted Zn-dependent peptidase
MRFFRLFCAVLLGGTLAQAAPLPLDQRVVEHTTANGIKLLILERHFSPTVSIRMIFRTGSVDEVDGKTGLAHMFEHMMFKGTRTLGTKDYAKEAPLLQKVDDLHKKIDKEKSKGAAADQALIGQLIDQLRDAEAAAEKLVIPNEMWNLYEREGGSNLNAGTSPDITQYQIDLPSNKLAMWAVIDSDRLKNPVFRQFYSEREVVKEERRMRIETNPDGKLYESFLGAAYKAHPYRHPTIGWAADLDHLTMEDLQDFYRRHYIPSRLTITVVGDVRAKDVIALVDKHFGTWTPPASPAVQRPMVAEPPQNGQRRETVLLDAEPHLFVGFRVPAYPDPDHIVFSALASLLAEGQSSRLYKSLVEDKRLATLVEADSSTPGERYDTQFFISIAPRFPHTAAEVEKALFQELEALKKTPIENWELEKVRARTDLDVLNVLQTNEGMASTLSFYQCIFKDWRYLLEYQKKIKTLSARDIQRAAQRIFRQENSTLVVRARKKK